MCEAAAPLLAPELPYLGDTPRKAYVTELGSPPGGGDDRGGAPRSESLQQHDFRLFCSFQTSTVDTCGYAADTRGVGGVSFACSPPTGAARVANIADAINVAAAAPPPSWTSQESCPDDDVEDHRRWHERMEALEAEAADLDVAIGVALNEGAAIGRAVAPNQEARAFEAATEVAAARAIASQAQYEAKSAEREEVLLEAVVRERSQGAGLHARHAQGLQDRAKALEAAAAQEQEVVKALSAELSALKSRALIEERRARHEARLRDIQLQVAEASARDVEEATEEHTQRVKDELAELVAQQERDLRRIRNIFAKELAALRSEVAFAEEGGGAVAKASLEASIAAAAGPTARGTQRLQAKEAAASLASSRGACNAQRRQPQAQHAVRDSTSAAIVAAKAAALQTELRERRGANVQRLAAARDEVKKEMRQIQDEAEETLRLQETQEMQLKMLEEELGLSVEVAASEVAAIDASRCRNSGLEQRIRDFAVMEEVALAEAESNAAKDMERRKAFQSHYLVLEGFVEELESEISRTEKVNAKRVDDTMQRLASARIALGEREAEDESCREARRKAACIEIELALECEEVACETESRNAAMWDGEDLQQEIFVRDRTLSALRNLRQALRDQHVAAEEAHEEAAAEEARVERALLHMRLEDLDEEDTSAYD